MKYLFRAAVLVLCVMLLSCGGKQDQASAIPTVSVIGTSMGPVPQGLPEVESAINAIIEKEIGVRVKLNIFEVGSYMEQVSLMMASQEKADLVTIFPGGPMSFSVMVAQNQLMDIGDLLNQHGQDLLKATEAIIPGYINATSIGGKVYGVSGFYNKVLNEYFLAREDILKKHNISIAELKSLDDIEAVLAKLKAAEPIMSAILPATVPGGALISMDGGCFFEDFAHPILMEIFGSVMAPLAVSFSDDPYKVVNVYKSAEYIKMLERVRRWYQAGYVYKDAAINTEMAEELVKSAKGISWITSSETGVEINKTAQTGFPIATYKITSSPISTGAMTKWGWGVPSYSKEGTAAVKFLNILYTDERITNLLTFGIEGRDYVAKPNGTIGYPEGVTSQTVPYHMVEFLYGNQFLMKVWEGNPPDFRQQILKENKEAPVSALMGFLFNPESVQNELSTITNMLDQYRAPLESGTIDFRTGLPEFLKALDDAGAEKIIAETQKQLDVWRIANKK
ncbi:ABC transporter substrate-binding protein [Spirochaetia bacterium]|nr:ABC transporter substrate-binding protein [Spirochaetia bacterium]